MTRSRKVTSPSVKAQFFRVYDAITWKYLEPYFPTMQTVLFWTLEVETDVGQFRSPKKDSARCKVFLVDISEGMLNVARQRVLAERLQDRIEIRKGDIRKLNCPNDTFDLVFSDHTFFLFEYQDEVVRELARVLKTNARMILSAQNRLV
jgi:ubiquinone/menaquinone biosynthesis C-methylase UbiE